MYYFITTALQIATPFLRQILPAFRPRAAQSCAFRHRCTAFPHIAAGPGSKAHTTSAPDLPASGEQAARNVRALRPLGLHRAGNEELTRRDGAAFPHHRSAVVSAHLGDEGVALRDDVRGRAVIRQLGLGHAVAHADVGAAAADVDRRHASSGSSGRARLQMSCGRKE